LTFAQSLTTSFRFLRILILASAVFYYGEGRNRSNSEDPASLFDAHDLLAQYVGKRKWRVRQCPIFEGDGVSSSAGVIFALALLFSGRVRLSSQPSLVR